MVEDKLSMAHGLESRVPFMDITGIQVLEEVMQKLRRRGIRVMLCEANERVLAKLQRAGVINEGSAEDYVDHLIDAIKKVPHST